MQSPIVLLANGNYPTHQTPLSHIQNAGSIICCDGAINQLVEKGYTPHIIIGDLDSINTKYKNKYREKLYHIPDQNENDLRKALQWLNNQNINDVTILGATGRREDHTLGNIFTLLQFPMKFTCRMITDFGTFTTIESSVEIKSFSGEQISIFSNDSKIKITSTGLKYYLNEYAISDLYSCTLNESVCEIITLTVSQGRIIIYQAFEENTYK